MAFQTFNKSFCSSRPYNPSRDDLDPRPFPESGAGAGALLFLSLSSKGILGLGVGACGRWVWIQQEGMGSRMQPVWILLHQ